MSSAIRDNLVTAFWSLAVGCALLYVSVGEYNRQTALISAVQRMDHFVETRPKVMIHYWSGICQRVRDLETESGHPEPINCSAIKSAIGFNLPIETPGQ